MRPPNHYPDPYDEALRGQFTSTGDLTFGFEIEEAHIQWWSDNFKEFGLYPRDVAERFGSDIPFDKQYKVDSIDLGKGHVRFEMRAFDQGEQVIFSGRSIEFDERLIHLNKTSIRDDRQGNTYGRRLLRNSFLLARDLNLEKLALTAIAHGPYVWAKAGFSVDPDIWAEGEVQARISEQLFKLPNSVLSYETKCSLLQAISEGDHRELWNVSALPLMVASSKNPGQMVSLGWYLLVDGEATWKGDLRIGDKHAEDRLTKYLAKAGIEL